MFRPIIKSCFVRKHLQACISSVHTTRHTGHKDTPETPASFKLVRRVEPGKVRLGFIPEEWFEFFYQKTGVTGPYLFGILVINYWLSKEIYILEHEFYSGLSVFVILVGVTKNLGPAATVALDKMVEEHEKEFANVYNAQIKGLEDAIMEAKHSQASATGQSMLFEAKKENIRMQLEANYRERFMLVYLLVKHRMDYHAKRYLTEARIHQKWMAAWILREVHAAINNDFKKRALESAIESLASISAK